jgi:hypothetical protein
VNLHGETVLPGPEFLKLGNVPGRSIGDTGRLQGDNSLEYCEDGYPKLPRARVRDTSRGGLNGRARLV